MQSDLRRSLARREMIRAATYSTTMEFPPLFAMAIMESLWAFLNTPSDITDEPQRAVARQIADGINSLLHPPNKPSIAEHLRTGNPKLPDYNLSGKSSLEWFTVLSCAAVGSRTIGNNSGGLITVLICNRFAAQLDNAGFPTMADMLRESTSSANDVPIPDRLLRDPARG